MIRRLRESRFALALFVAVASCGTAFAAPSWDHIANVKDAANRLGQLHRHEGSKGVLKFLDACYRTHMLASTYTAGLEACMAQDYMHTQILAQIYARLPADERAKTGAPSPELIADGMGKRFLVAFSQYNVSGADAETFKKLVDTHGFPIFLKAVFPKSPNPKAPKDDAAGDDAQKNNN